jgi:hypothetical protein
VSARVGSKLDGGTPSACALVGLVRLERWTRVAVALRLSARRGLVHLGLKQDCQGTDAVVSAVSGESGPSRGAICGAAVTCLVGSPTLGQGAQCCGRRTSTPRHSLSTPTPQHQGPIVVVVDHHSSLLLPMNNDQRLAFWHVLLWVSRHLRLVSQV